MTVLQARGRGDQLQLSLFVLSLVDVLLCDLTFGIVIVSISPLYYRRNREQDKFYFEYHHKARVLRPELEASNEETPSLVK